MRHNRCLREEKNATRKKPSWAYILLSTLITWRRKNNELLLISSRRRRLLKAIKLKQLKMWSRRSLNTNWVGDCEALRYIRMNEMFRLLFFLHVKFSLQAIIFIVVYSAVDIGDGGKCASSHMITTNFYVLEMWKKEKSRASSGLGWKMV